MVDPEEQRALARIGQVLGGHWRLERLLGVGGMAAVYAARSEYGSEAAVKVLHADMNQREDVRSRFVQEGELARHLDHQGVVRIRGVYADPGSEAYLVMELLQGETLTDRLSRDEPFTEAQLLAVLDQLLDVLAEAHAKGIVHRDLKPDNLFLKADGTLKVLDFGIARRSGANVRHKTNVGVALGTVPYMAPEQAMGKHADVDARTDLFAVGAMAFRILSGRNVHLAKSDGELLISMATKPAPPLRTVAPTVRPELAHVVDMALAFSKDSRYQDARAMQGDVRALLSGGAPTHASKAVAAREMSTRVDLAAPAAEAVARAGAPAATVPVPEPAPRTALSAADEEPAAVQVVPVTPKVIRVNVERPPPSVPRRSERTQLSAVAPKSGSQATLWIAVAAVLVLLGGAAAYLLLGRSPPDPAAAAAAPAPLPGAAPAPAAAPAGAPPTAAPRSKAPRSRGRKAR